MQLTETQIKQANKLIKKYKFCTLETQKELQENGFFEAVKPNFGIAFPKEKYVSEGYGTTLWNYIEAKTSWSNIHNILPMPQFNEVWAILPVRIDIIGRGGYREISVEGMTYRDSRGAICLRPIMHENICEAACLLWLKLKKQNLL